MGVKGEITYF